MYGDFFTNLICASGRAYIEWRLWAMSGKTQGEAGARETGYKLPTYKPGHGGEV